VLISDFYLLIYCLSATGVLTAHSPLLQLVDITGKDQDESMIALHDCNGDVNRAINALLEGSPDTVSTGPLCAATAPE